VAGRGREGVLRGHDFHYTAIVFRRSSAGAQAGTAQDATGAQSLAAPDTTRPAGKPGGKAGGAPDGKAGRRPAEAAKGRPTPKRSEAERRRRQPITGKGAGGQNRARDRTDRSRLYEARKRGEEWALQPKDRGPVKALARDYVDSRRRVGEYYMWVLLALVIIMFARVPAVQEFSTPVILVLVVVVVAEGLMMRRDLHRLVAERFPGESTRGVTWYAVMRSLQIRKLRVPAPRIRPGDKF